MFKKNAILTHLAICLFCPSFIYGIDTLTPSNYRTVLKEALDKPSSLVLLPPEFAERQIARKLAKTLSLPVMNEPSRVGPLPAYPLQDIDADTNLIVLSCGRGGALTQSLRRAMFISENQRIPGTGGYFIRTIARPFAKSAANVIAISAGDAASLEIACETFAKNMIEDDDHVIYDCFLQSVPGSAWENVRGKWYEAKAGDEYFKYLWDEFNKATSARAFAQRLTQLSIRYYMTGNDEYARIYKKLFSYHDYPTRHNGKSNKDGHMGLFLLMSSWDRIEESSVFTEAERLENTKYLLECLRGPEGIDNYTTQITYAYTPPLNVRQNHQTITANGLMCGYLYFNRLYNLKEADRWKAWCDEVAQNANIWNNIEDSENYLVRAYVEVGRLYNLQGLSTENAPGTDSWLQTAKMFISARNSYIMPATFGDCWGTATFYSPAGVICGDNVFANVFDDQLLHWLETLKTDWDYTPAQWLIDRAIIARRMLKSKGWSHIRDDVDPKRMSRPHMAIDPTSDEFAYLFGSSAVGGPANIAPPVLSDYEKQSLDGFVITPVHNDFMAFRAGKIEADSPNYFSGKRAWAATWQPPLAKAFNKISYRSGWDYDDDFLFVDGMGFDFNHGHNDMGSIVQYASGGHIWLADFGYAGGQPEYKSTLEVRRNGKPDAYYHWHPKALETLEKEYRYWPSIMGLDQLKLADRGQGSPEYDFTVEVENYFCTTAKWQRRFVGGKGHGLKVIDTVTAGEDGEYEFFFRLRVLGELEGSGDKWITRQQGKSMDIKLQLAKDDAVSTVLMTTEGQGTLYRGRRYYWYPFVENLNGPTTITWSRKMKMKAGEKTVFEAMLSPEK